MKLEARLSVGSVVFTAFSLSATAADYGSFFVAAAENLCMILLCLADSLERYKLICA